MTRDQSEDKPLGESLGWHRLSTGRPYQSHWHNLRQDAVRLPDGQEILYTYQEHPGFVTVLPVTVDGQVVMIRSYRYTVDDWCWELPAGGLGDKPDASREQVARDELAEETGGECLSMEEVGWFYAMNGTSDARCHVFIARGVQLNGQPRLEPTEQSEIRLVPLAQAFQMAQDGRITDADSALVLLRYAPLLMDRHRTIEVVPFDSEWSQLFEAEAARLTVALRPLLLAIHHMGSTAVPGLWAKPTIDIMPIVKDVRRLEQLNDRMAALGYVPKGEYGIPGRRFYSLTVNGRRLFNVHAYEPDNPEVPRHLNFVAYLRTHPESAAAYGQLKLELALRFPDDMDGYVDGKTDFIREIDRLAARSTPADLAVSGSLAAASNVQAAGAWRREHRGRD